MRILLTVPGVRIVPAQLPLERGWRWCLLTTIRDLRLSSCRQRTLSLPNTRRLYLRRFNELCAAQCIAEGNSLREHYSALGEAFLQQHYRAQIARLS